MKITFKTILFFLVLLCGLTWLAVIYFPDSKLKLVFCDVGQGDAALILKGSIQILIDGGPNDKVMTCLRNNMPLFDRKIEVIALTHPEADHMTGLLLVLDKYSFDYFLMGPEGNKSAGFTKLLNKLEILGTNNKIGWEVGNESRSEGEKWVKDNITQPHFPFPTHISSLTPTLIHIINPYSGTRIKVGDLILDTLWPQREWVAERVVIPTGRAEGEEVEESLSINGQEKGSLDSARDDTSIYQTSDITASGNGTKILGYTTTNLPLNQFSLVFLLKYKDKRVLLMGDADSKIQNKIAGLQETGNSLSGIDILKYPHHGSKTGMTEDFLKQINPGQAVISVGKNSYGHPTPETLDLLNRFNIIIRRTDIEGEIKFTF